MARARRPTRCAWAPATCSRRRPRSSATRTSARSELRSTALAPRALLAPRFEHEHALGVDELQRELVAAVLERHAIEVCHRIRERRGAHRMTGELHHVASDEVVDVDPVELLVAQLTVD